MSERQPDETTADQSRQLMAPPKRELLITHSQRAIWDSSDFQHTGRVAAVMADSHLLPVSFRGVMKGQGDNAVLEPFERTQVIANAMILCTIAREFEANPFLLMQCASLISGRIMLEGKVIAAAIAHRTGIRLKYEFGLWDTDHFAPVSDPSELHGAGERLAVRVSGQFADEDEPRTVEGSVGQWKTTRAGSPWSKVADWPRQLRYRGAREWGRAHAPGVTLGMYGDGDDFEDDPAMDGPKPREKRNLKGALKASGEAVEGDQGFDRAGVAEALGDTHTAEDAEFEDRPTTEAGPTATAPVQSAESEPASPASAEGASAASQDPKASGQKDTAEPTKSGAVGPVTVEGPAPADETYFLFGDAVGADGKRITYQNGVRFSSSKALDKFKAYTEHAPEFQAPEPEPDEPDLGVPCEACGAAAGEPCADDCPDAAEEGAGISTGEDRVDPAQAETVEEEPSAEEPTGFLATLKPMRSWLDEFKPALTAMFKTSDWMSAEEIDKNAARKAIWEIVVASGAKVDQAEDPSAYGLWLAWIGDTRDDADAVEGTFRVLQGGERWAKMTPPARKPLEDRTAAKLKSIRG